MAKSISLLNYPKLKATVVKDLLKECGNKKLTFPQLCEVMALAEILSNTKICRSLKMEFTDVTFHNYSGPDIIFCNSNTLSKLTVEIKGSFLKKDYMNKSNYSRGKQVKFWGNSLKFKDFNSETGKLEADIVVLVCCNAENKDLINNTTQWKYLLFNNDDIQKLEPKSTVFLPTYCISAMVINKQSYFTDEYSGLHKGLVQIIKFNETDDVNVNSKVKKDFLKVWKDVDCFIYQKEHRQIVHTVWETIHFDSWDKLLRIDRINKEGKFIMSKMLQSHQCGIMKIPKNKNYNVNCQKCQGLISELK